MLMSISLGTKFEYDRTEIFILKVLESFQYDNQISKSYFKKNLFKYFI
jgi:hypothetical protein